MLNKHSRKPIGIIGGMGPDASARLYGRMIAMARDEFNVTENHEYPEIVLQSVPVPEFFSNEKKKTEALEMLKDRIKKLISQPICGLAVACNTAHIVLEELEKINGFKMVSIPEEVVKVAVEKKYKKVGLLGSPTTILSGVYQTEFLDKEIEVVIPENGYIEELGEIIGELVAGNLKGQEQRLLKVADDLVEKKVEVIILGCTELPLAFPQNYQLPVLDSVEILARSLLNKYYKGKI